MDEQRFRTVLNEELADSQDKLLLRLSSLGLDIHRPLEQQADFKHLRRWRKIVESTTTRVIVTLVTLAITGAVGAAAAPLIQFLKGS